MEYTDKIKKQLGAILFHPKTWNIYQLVKPPSPTFKGTFIVGLADRIDNDGIVWFDYYPVSVLKELEFIALEEFEID